ncbi:MAG: hypothetical protein RL189_702, partial [Pseudomonadota bacterium]
TNLIIIVRLPIFTRPELPELSSNSDSRQRPTVIVLGAGVRRRELSGMLRCRMLKAIELYNNQRSTRVLLSGDGTDPHYNETTAMRKFALQNGINADALLTDPLGFSTYDSLRRAIEVFGIRSAMIVSQDFHLQRAIWLANSFGIEASGESCDAGSSSYFYDFREILARCKDVFLRWFDFAPRSNREEIF